MVHHEFAGLPPHGPRQHTNDKIHFIATEKEIRDNPRSIVDVSLTGQLFVDVNSLVCVDGENVGRNIRLGVQCCHHLSLMFKTKGSAAFNIAVWSRLTC